ncbi:sensor histidine kinase [Clostridium tetani]|uniref:HAMP domain-containing sensor histidine kinase n=2 Tax=Clostridium tetani TaxID=1513 RepID=UPI00100BA93C|nr:HAMP domain-containing sensor histidine kinase [Clostridium tetani]RXI46506.1 sensor histidine kinase [Clostridium tetani]RXM61569.1 sensor histidine kinase [Clostridium tetani]RXM66266.1 sensor histidine kinase [Clostridium tetani]
MKTRMKNKKKISNLLLRNYIISNIMMFITLIIFFIITIIMWITLFLPINNLLSEEKSKLLAENIMADDYKKIDASEVLKVEGWVEVVDSNFKVVKVKGEQKNKRNFYTKKEFYKLVKENNDGLFENKNYIINIDYNENKDFFLVVYLPNDNYFITTIKDQKIKPRTFFRIAILGYIIIFALIMIMYAKFTSKNLTMPLKELMKGVKKIIKGDYSTRIYLKSQNEFGDLRDAFNLMVEKIEEERKLKEKSEDNRKRLMLDISHDLKNPLASIRGYSNYLIENKEISNKEKEKYLKIIENNSIRVNDLITDLFELSKFESIDFSIDFEKMDICELIREIIANHIPQMEDKDMVYSFYLPENEVFIMGNEKNLYRAISNLLENSIKYNEKGTKIQVSLEEYEESVGIEVVDNGIGIPKKLKQDIFNPFIRVDTSRNSKQGGTGLGLAITKAIVEKHKGEIKLISDIDKGARFKIKLYKIVNNEY